LSIALARTANAFLYGLRPTDPTSIALAAILLTSITVAASFLPALRASRVDPMAALREE
jgi:ABC-type antimicrobial peptide transport system permease subunit